jgi:hypothetical protein
VTAVVAAVVLAILGATSSVVGRYQQIRSHGVSAEQQIMKTYSANEVVYNTMATTLVDQLGIAGQQKDAAIQVFKAAMQGRFGDNPTQGQLMTWTQENYPDVTINQKTFADIATKLANNREKFAQAQLGLMDQARAYTTWLKASWPNSVYIGWAGFPSNDLTVTRGGVELKGAAALKALSDPMTTSAVKKAFDKNQDGSLVPTP